MFRVEAEQGAEDGPGWCRLRLHGLDGGADAVELSIRRPGASRVYLGPADWEENESWLRLPATREGGALIARLGPPQTLRLAGASTIEVRARVRGAADKRTRLAWPRIVLPAENDAAKADAPVVLPPQGPRPQPWAKPAPVPELAAQAELRSAPLRSAPQAVAKPVSQLAAWNGDRSARTWLAILLIALLLPAASWLLASWKSAERTAEIPAPQASTRSFTEEWVRAFLARDPDAPSATAEAALFEAAGHSDLALLLYRHAARKGEPKAAMAIGRMYDPDGFDPGRSPFATPDADQAASFYEQAAEAGDAEAQYRLGRLLLSGRTAGEADAERGAVWLQRAAGQGHAQARSTLERLKVN
jgi:TPR repeat protein